MVDILLVLASTAEAAEETSHMPFYVMGGLLALWATVIAFFGISKRTTYPAGDGGRNLVVLVTLVLVVGACASAALTG
ncbi:MAG: hypothetical protein M3P40_12120 [Actinomycetota bacterium]|nr:hypothetical protein [Actinomycetota bacterium]